MLCKANKNRKSIIERAEDDAQQSAVNLVSKIKINLQLFGKGEAVLVRSSSIYNQLNPVNRVAAGDSKMDSFDKQ